MSQYQPGTWPDKLVGYCISFLVGSIVLYAAIQLLTAIWSTLLLILGGCLFVAVLVPAWRSRSQRW